jgi:hypothetical protein
LFWSESSTAPIGDGQQTFKQRVAGFGERLFLRRRSRRFWPTGSESNRKSCGFGEHVVLSARAKQKSWEDAVTGPEREVLEAFINLPAP